ncbi:glutathionylspermidine synthase family protein [Sphingomonas immobilis]|uniref:Glutathionylspermidine synthase family protein n=1 Tax=Sphingomonas immobilis TaxID=3063997 RepID=A0ABT9A1J5_9SPHN|nr:glutathionylspermidine synthase family protein [Sphingomonas sp. CA1-15]MDO7843688.1 glutathionylspermidine synthase family protein [Sphingomonas sp. CA1-15]
MIRRTLAPRPDWQHKVEALGLVWHSVDGRPYWDESACYSFTAAEVRALEAATADLYEMFLAAGQRVIDTPDMMAAFGIPELARAAIRDSWDAEPPALNYGRFDLGYDGKGPPKLFEFNCDTPTSLIEAAVVQWAWKEECFPGSGQWNDLHDALVAKWRDLAPLLPEILHFAHVADDAGEDTITTTYLRDTAAEAGVASEAILIDDLGWDAARRCFVDLDERQMRAIFKLYPWEWLVGEAFGANLIESLPATLWIEPVWKMIWSNKAILAVLWDMYPGHPNLLGASLSVPPGDAIAKPLLAREGANVSMRKGGAVVAETGGDYGEEGYVYQEIFALPETAPGVFPVLGSWVVDGVPAGLGIREDGLITGNTARFVPHIVEG